MRHLIYPLLLAPLFNFALSQHSVAEEEEIVKWVDENGKVHFSDRPPADKKIKVEKLKNVEAPKLGLNENELAEQKRRTQMYKNRVEHERRQKQLEQSEADKDPNKEAQSETKEPEIEAIKITYEYCRNTYKTNTRLRTECFNKISEQKR